MEAVVAIDIVIGAAFVASVSRYAVANDNCAVGFPALTTAYSTALVTG